MIPVLRQLLFFPRLSAYLLGAFCSLSFAPVYFFPALFVSFWGLLHLIDHSRSTRSLCVQLYLFGLGFFNAGLYWIGVSFKMVDMAWLGVPAVMGLSLFLAIFFLLIVLFTIPFACRSLERRISVAVGFALCEWLRGHLFTGFPWNLTGSIWGAYTWPYFSDFGLSVLQITAYIGIYGLSFLTILFAVLVTSKSSLCRWLTVASFCIVFILGGLRLHHNQTLLLPINIRLIQPSLDQHLKWLPENFERNLQLQLALSSLEAERPISAIIWPESSVTTFVNESGLTSFMNESKDLLWVLASVIPENGYLIVGTPRRENASDLSTTLSVINEKAEITHVYKKAHLVPFGEYVPFKAILPVTKLTAGSVDFIKGDGLKTMILPNLPPLSPLICYEALFPGEVTESTKTATIPSWLLNITNDAWYGVSSGPYQHLALVRIRAIEEGIPLVRAANNGISAVVDPCGRILHKLGLNDIGFIDFELPKPIASTFYQKNKEASFFGLLGLGFFIATLMRQRRFKQR